MEHLADCKVNTRILTLVFCGLWRLPNGLTDNTPSQWTNTCKGCLPRRWRQKTSQWKTGNILACRTPHRHHYFFFLYLCVHCATRKQWLFSDPSLVPTVKFSAVVFSASRGECRSAANDADGRSWKWGGINKHLFTLTQTYSCKWVHAYSCTIIHSATTICCCIYVQYMYSLGSCTLHVDL